MTLAALLVLVVVIVTSPTLGQFLDLVWLRLQILLGDAHLCRVKVAAKGLLPLLRQSPLPVGSMGLRQGYQRQAHDHRHNHGSNARSTAETPAKGDIEGIQRRKLG